jgi:hypothetical protein
MRSSGEPRTFEEVQRRWRGLQDYGLSLKLTSAGRWVVTVDYFAHVANRAPGWLRSARDSCTDLASFQQEYLRSYLSSKGQTIFPEFVSAQQALIRPARHLIAGPVLRGWDFGQNPACVWAQIDEERRVWFLRECCPRGISTAAFRDLVQYLSGLGEYDELPEKAREWLAGPGAQYPEPPWFDGRRLEFIDFGGHESRQGQANVDDDEKKTAEQILAVAGIALNVVWVKSAGRKIELFKQLLTQRADGTYGMYIDPACVILVRAFAGGFRLPKPTAARPSPETPLRDGLFEHPVDAAGYLVVANIEIEASGAHKNYERVVKDQKMDFYETRG